MDCRKCKHYAGNNTCNERDGFVLEDRHIPTGYCSDHKEIEDPVNRPAHYNDGKIEVIDYIEDKKLGFCLGNAIKYISRAGKKNPDKEVEDLNKAIWYIKRRIKEIEEGIA